MGTSWEAHTKRNWKQNLPVQNAFVDGQNTGDGQGRRPSFSELPDGLSLKNAQSSVDRHLPELKADPICTYTADCSDMWAASLSMCFWPGHSHSIPRPVGSSPTDIWVLMPFGLDT